MTRKCPRLHRAFVIIISGQRKTQGRKRSIFSLRGGGDVLFSQPRDPGRDFYLQQKSKANVKECLSVQLRRSEKDTSNSFQHLSLSVLNIEIHYRASRSRRRVPGNRSWFYSRARKKLLTDIHLRSFLPPSRKEKKGMLPFLAPPSHFSLNCRRFFGEGGKRGSRLCRTHALPRGDHRPVGLINSARVAGPGLDDRSRMLRKRAAKMPASHSAVMTRAAQRRRHWSIFSILRLSKSKWGGHIRRKNRRLAGS